MLRARRFVAAYAGLMFLGLSLLGVRLVWVQVGRSGEATRAMARQSLRQETLQARRGQLLDRHGRMLAGSVEAVRLEVLPRNVLSRSSDPLKAAGLVRDLCRYLSPRVGASHEDLSNRFMAESWTRLGRPVSEPAVIDELLSERRGLLYGIDITQGWARSYPWGATAGNLIGYVNHDGRGVSGLEQGLDRVLAGQDGTRTVRVDHLGRRIDDGTTRTVPAHDGLNVHLTLDARIQQIVEEEAARTQLEQQARRVVVVAMDPASGDVLAMTSTPGVDLSDPADRSRDGSVVGAVQQMYPPGSTFKPLMMAAALELGLAHPGEAPIDCTSFDNPRRRIRDTHPVDHPLTLEEILVHSSNIGMATILTRIVPADDPKNTELMAPVHGFLVRLGLGRRTGVPLPAEVPGRVTPLSRWHRNYTLASVAFGQELGVSALQMAAAASTLFDGWYRPPRLVAAFDDDGLTLPSPAVRPEPVFSGEVARLVRTWMVRAVEEGACAEVRIEDLPVAGKTGTATGETKEGGEVHSYVALVPADDPEITLVVVVHHPQNARYAAASAAPAAGRILRRLLPYLGHTVSE